MTALNNLKHFIELPQDTPSLPTLREQVLRFYKALFPDSIYDDEYIYERFIHSQAFLPKQEGEHWIGVKERLPENDDLVMVFSSKFGKGGISSIVLACFENGKWAVDTEYGRHKDYDNNPDYWWITHWMPLPESPFEIAPTGTVELVNGLHVSVSGPELQSALSSKQEPDRPVEEIPIEVFEKVRQGAAKEYPLWESHVYDNRGYSGYFRGATGMYRKMQDKIWELIGNSSKENTELLATIEALKEAAQGWEAQYHQAEGKIESLKEELSTIKHQCEKEPLTFLLSNALRLLSVEQMISLADSLYERTPAGSGIRAELAKYKDQSPKY